jgi:hypothetical protein
MADDLLLSVVPILLIGVIGLFVGGVIGALLVGSLRGQNETQEQAQDKNLLSALRIWRDRQSGRLILEYEGEKYRTTLKLTAGQRATVAELLNEARTWLGLRETASQVEAVPVSETSLSKPTESPAVAQANFQPLVPVEMAPAVDSDLPAAAISAGAAGAVLSAQEGKGKEKIKEAPKSIVGQIDEILQEKLPLTSLNTRSIRLIELPDKGMLVMVDGQAFEGVGDVADPEVKQLIQACVAEWENSK